MSNNFRSEAVLEYELKNVSVVDVGAYSSKIFFVRNLPWQIIVRIKPVEDKKYIGIYLKCSYAETDDWSCPVERKTKLINFQNNLATMTIYHEKREYTARETCRGVNKFARFDHIADTRHGFVRDDSLKIIVEIKVGLPRNCNWTMNDLFNILNELSVDNVNTYTELQAKDKLKFIKDIQKSAEKEFQACINKTDNGRDMENELQVAEKKNLQQQLIIKETRKKLGDAKEENSKMRLDILKLEMEKNDLTLALENLKLETENAKLEEKRKRSVRFSENGYAESSSYVFLKTRTEDKYVVVPKKMLADHWPSALDNCVKDKVTGQEDIILDMESGMLLKILNFFQSGKFQKSFRSIYDIIEICKKHNIRTLEEYCKDKIMEDINVDNAINTLIIVKSKNIGDLKSRIIKYIRKNLDKFTSTDKWKEFSDKHAELSRQILQKKTVD